MALFKKTTKCIYCGKEISKRAVTCPYCGKKINNHIEDNGLIDFEISNKILGMRERGLHKQLTIGRDFYAVIKQDGSINFVPDTDENRVKRIFALSDTAAVRNGFVQGIDDWTDIVSIDSGGDFVIGLKKNGTVLASGSNENWACEVESWINVDCIQVIGSTTFGYCDDGSVYCTNPKIVIPQGTKYVKAGLISDRDNEYVLLTQDGKLVFSCENSQIDAEYFSNILDFCTNSKEIAAIKNDGTVITNNEDLNGKIALWKNVIKIEFVSFDKEKGLVGLTSDGKMLTTNSNILLSIPNGWDEIVDFKVGHEFIIGLNSNGIVVSAGNNDCNCANTESWSDVVSIYSSWNSSIGLKANGECYLNGILSGGSLGVIIGRDFPRTIVHSVLAKYICNLLPGRTFVRSNIHLIKGMYVDELSVDVMSIAKEYPQYDIRSSPQVSIMITYGVILAIARNENGWAKPVKIYNLDGTGYLPSVKMHAQDIYLGIKTAQQML